MGGVFSEEYGRVRENCGVVREQGAGPDEALLQRAWLARPWGEAELRTVEGHQVRVLSPGWHNPGEGPDFLNAQLLFNGVLHAGDVELHLEPGGWRAHGHQQDSRYDNVILHVVFRGVGRSKPVIRTKSDRRVATLVLGDLISDFFPPLEGGGVAGDPARCGRCAEGFSSGARGRIPAFLRLAGQWRMVAKARALRERADTAGMDQAVYEAVMAACGYSRYKAEFRMLARQLPYERAAQLARQDPFLLEAAYFVLAGLFPEAEPETDNAAALDHYRRLRNVRESSLPGLRCLGAQWPRAGVRPANLPERRLAGAARIVARTAATGLAAMVEHAWREPLAIRARLDRFSEFFPAPLGFWARHYTWTGRTQPAPVAVFGAGRALSVTGNVFVPAGLATARKSRNLTLEARVLEFFEWMPGEPDNSVTKKMKRWLLNPPPRSMSFQLQQGLLQMHQDWCETNPSCRNCAFARYLEESPPADSG